MDPHDDPLLDENYLLGCWLLKREDRFGKANIGAGETQAALEAIRITRKVALKLLDENKK